MIPDPSAEQVLRWLGVTAASDIDLDAIAWELGLVGIKERELDGREERIFVMGNRAIVSLDPRPNPRRRRFSLAHKMGHWIHHRGRPNFSEEIGEARDFADVEQSAHRFASNLLLTRYLIGPLARSADRLILRLVGEIADEFDATKSVTAPRFVQQGDFPVLVIKYDLTGRIWFQRSPLITARWPPGTELDHDAYPFDILCGAGADQTTRAR